MTLFARMRQVAMVGGVETFAVAMGALTGLLIVNVLPKDQYAAYTFLITCMQLILGIADLGLSKCALPVVGQRNAEVPWVVGVCRQILRLRRYLLIASLLAVAPYGIYAYYKHGWIGWNYGAAAAVMLLVVVLTLQNHYVNAILVILGKIPTVVRIGFITTAGRLAIVSAVLLLPITPYTALWVIAATAVAEVLCVALYRRAFRAESIAQTRLGPVEANSVNQQVRKIAVPLIPSAIYFHFQGSVTVFLVSLFGTTDMLAEIGAFGRLGLALLIVDRVFGVLLFPWMARAPAGSRLAVMIVRVHAGYILGMLCILATGILWPQYWILLIGEKYRSLESLLWLMFLASMLMNLAGLAFQTLAVRGITEKQALGVPLVIGFQVAFLWVFGVTDIETVLWFNVVTCAVHFVYQYWLLGSRWIELTGARILGDVR